MPLIVAIWTIFSFVVEVFLLLPFAWLYRGRSRAWVMGGHRGRLYADNAGALHEYIAENTTQRAYWICNDPAAISKTGVASDLLLKRHSLRARWHILTAPVLIYSHGESDLDLGFQLLRSLVGFRVYLNHSMNYVKAGEYYTPYGQRVRGLARLIFHWLITDFDVLLANSPLEAHNFALSYPHKKNSIVLGGGAHLDRFLRHRHQPPGRSIFYFPTFREDTASRARLDQMIQDLAHNQKLKRHLAANDLTLKIGQHVNSTVSNLDGERVEFVAPGQTLDALWECQVFISDYSGLIFDYLPLSRPIIFFPFDLQQYLESRQLYTPYEDLAYGPVATDVDALVDYLCDASWHHKREYLERAKQWKFASIVNDEPIYCQQGYEAILRELKLRAPNFLPTTASNPRP